MAAAKPSNRCIAVDCTGSYSHLLGSASAGIPHYDWGANALLLQASRFRFASLGNAENAGWQLPTYLARCRHFCRLRLDGYIFLGILWG